MSLTFVEQIAALDGSETVSYRDVRKIAARADARIAELEQSVTIRDTEIARMETDLEIARINAERYRWLRAGHTGGPYVADWHGCLIAGDDADEEIDAARAGCAESGA